MDRNPEYSRKRYVTDKEYELALNIKGPAYVPIAMELAYLCRMRIGEILKATKDQITSEGFETKRLKGSKDAITLWSDRLRIAFESAKNIPSKVTNLKSKEYILHDNYGLPITETAWKSAWTRRKVKMAKAGINPFNIHDLKRKGVSDFKGTISEKLDVSGHKTMAQLSIYDVKIKKVKPTK